MIISPLLLLATLVAAPPTEPPVLQWAAYLNSEGVVYIARSLACSTPQDFGDGQVGGACYAGGSGDVIAAVSAVTDDQWTFVIVDIGTEGTNDAIEQEAESAFDDWTGQQSFDLSAATCATAGSPGTTEIVAICYGLRSGPVAYGSSSVDGGVTWAPFELIP